MRLGANRVSAPHAKQPTGGNEHVTQPDQPLTRGVLEQQASDNLAV
jgi:hypothetical protein